MKTDNPAAHASTSSLKAPVKVSANPEVWHESQNYELTFWKTRWPYRDWPLPELQKLRLEDAAWLLKNLGFNRASPQKWDGFAGTVLEVGCGPLGFFELTEGVDVTANDSLMAAYAREIPFSTLGRRGSANYITQGVQDITETYDFVVCSNVLDHTADWMEFLELLVNRVKPAGGQLLLVTDTRGNPIPGHTQVFSPGQLMRALKWMNLDILYHRTDDKSQAGHCDHQVFVRAKLR